MKSGTKIGDQRYFKTRLAKGKKPSQKFIFVEDSFWLSEKIEFNFVT